MEINCENCAGRGYVGKCCGEFEYYDHGMLGVEQLCCGRLQPDDCESCNSTGKRLSAPAAGGES